MLFTFYVSEIGSPNIIFLMETMLDPKILEKIRNSCGYIGGLCLSSLRNLGGCDCSGKMWTLT